MQKVLISILFILCLISADALGQKTAEEGYVVITYERKRNKDQHGAQKFYWVVPVDSLSSKDATLSPLYCTGYSDEHLISCQQGDVTSIFTVDNSMNLESIEWIRNEARNLLNIIEKNKRLHQTIVKKWPKGYKEEIKVYITPIQGNLASCFISESDGNKINYSGMIYLPIGDATYFKSFWNSELVNESFFNDLTRKRISTSPYY
jgi:hypothetical protein